MGKLNGRDNLVFLNLIYLTAVGRINTFQKSFKNSFVNVHAFLIHTEYCDLKVEKSNEGVWYSTLLRCISLDDIKYIFFYYTIRIYPRALSKNIRTNPHRSRVGLIAISTILIRLWSTSKHPYLQIVYYQRTSTHSCRSGILSLRSPLDMPVLSYASIVCVQLNLAFRWFQVLWRRCKNKPSV